ncbi:mechanosensitive ion channel family protein [Enterobacter ludwigii]|uniref:mechanosensitive ion channel family protein n=1 Tax=Enterobacter ludwigii TaxID=299767 RepID=UPI002074BA3E|nr:mechanosensitive ion channel domain-containing protein [Enterobacter ludwigii]MCM7364946.1 mechanosensitive ion channel family protein [Enterobacter ludwigii]MDW5474621.1 mechanosensitive ion channel [Enterobacter ludwigii]WLK82697.1 mechanosensitive ion channel [Enterobacter ludwigii]
MKRILLVTLSCLLSVISFLSVAAEPRQEPTDRERARTVYIFHQPIVMLQAKFGLTTPEERVLRIRNTLRNFSQQDVREPLKIIPVTRYNQPGRLIVMNGKPVMLLAQADLDEGDDLTLDEAAQRVLTRMEAQRTALRDQYDAGWLALSAGKTAAGLLALFVFWYGAWQSWRGVRRFYRGRILENRSIIPQSWRRFVGAIETRLYALLMIILGILGLYIWLSWSFSLFPWTRVWGSSLGDWTMRVLRDIALSIVSAMPGILIVLIIFLITAFILKLLKVLLNQVEAGRLHLPGIHPETVGATRKLISVVVWLFALSAAYPFLPGANSLAFKGISVFFGLMLTLGSAGVMNHAMSGLVLIYSRALRKGDIIRVADNEGLVTEIGMLATKIITRENYVVTVPNAVVVSGKITNLSAQNPDGGVNLTTGVTIGYDTPWRQVHAMLEIAARRAKCIDQSQQPLVRQLSLMDWYIAYELQVKLRAGQSLAEARNELHSNIQDVFNEFNVQIMSPNFVMQPEGTVVVAEDNWYAAPAEKPENKQRE